MSGDTRALVKRGRHLLASHDVAAAEACFREATSRDPEVGDHWALLGRCEALRRGYHAALEALSRACQLDPRHASAHVWLAHAWREHNRPEAAVAAMERARVLDPGNVTAALGAALMTPVVARDQDEIAQWRARCGAGLARLASAKALHDGWSRRILELDWSNFFLAYQGHDDRALQVGCADFVSGLVARALPQAPTVVRPRSRAGRLRVGFASTHLCRHTVVEYFGSWMTKLPRERFHVTLFHLGHGNDDVTAALRGASDRFVDVPGDVIGFAREAEAADLDVMVYPDIGMSPVDLLTSNLRLAPVQLAAWGHPVTTGSRHIDAYLSCEGMEPPEGAKHYQERLVLLPGIGVDYAAHRQEVAARREHFRLPLDAKVLVCPHSLFKIHPDTDALFLRILAADPGAVLVFIASPAKGQTEAFAARLSLGMHRQGLPMQRQVKVLPPLSRAAFLELLASADVMLDPLHWSGGNTALDALATGLPVVTLPGTFMRGRQSAAMLRILGAPECIASDPDDYVEKAVRIGREDELRRALANRLRENAPRLFGRTDHVAVFAETVERLHQECVDAVRC